jgi:hypothetical protein
LFFEPLPTGQAAAHAFLARLDQRTTDDRDAPISNETIGAQLAALTTWEQDTSPTGLAALKQPASSTATTNTMWHTATGTLRLAHGGIFQYYAVFVQQALDFLRN